MDDDMEPPGGCVDVAPSTAATLPVPVHLDLNSISLVSLNGVKGTISGMAPFAEFTLSEAKGSG
jgi:hypothetical protein